MNLGRFLVQDESSQDNDNIGGEPESYHAYINILFLIVSCALGSYSIFCKKCEQNYSLFLKFYFEGKFDSYRSEAFVIYYSYVSLYCNYNSETLHDGALISLVCKYLL